MLPLLRSLVFLLTIFTAGCASIGGSNKHELTYKTTKNYVVFRGSSKDPRTAEMKKALLELEQARLEAKWFITLGCVLKLVSEEKTGD